METVEREDILRQFKSDADDGFDIIVSTNAFGMGVDVRRLGFVIHFDTPATPEAYYQEAGRAGRDRIFKEGKECAQCILLFHPSDLDKHRFLSSKNVFSDYEIEDVYKAICEIYERGKEPLEKPIDLSNSETLLSQGNDERHIFASVQEIAMRAGVKEDQVGTLLYYLEEQTTDTPKGQKVFERGTLVSNVWLLKFEKDYQARLNELPSSSSSWRLVHAFQNADGGYLLNTSQFTTISARELADSLKQSLKFIEDELTNLSKRRIVTYAGSGRFKFTSPVDMLSTRLKDLKSDLKSLFHEINKPPKKALERNELVTVNLRTIMSQKGIKTVTYAQATKFLFTYAHENVEPLRLLECFNRVTRNGQPDTYEMQLWLKRNLGSVLKTIDDIIDQLGQTVEILASKMADQANYHDWHAIDLFASDLNYNYDKRRKFHQNLLVLEALGLLQYISDTAMGQAMHMSLLQPPVALEHLHIELDALRLQEKYAKSKRKIMEQYASMTQKDLYAKQFAMYFQGAEPLLEHSQQELRQDLTPQQRQIATLKGGIHVIEGPAGCGKTATLAEHVKYLVNQGVPIDHILITTHYKSAEGHIAEALKDLEGEGATAVSTTINAFGQKIFTQYRYLLLKPDGTPYYGGEQEPQVLSTRDQTEETAMRRAHHSP